MDVSQLLHMNGGMGETSYATNSWLQRKVISMTKPITEAAIASLIDPGYSAMMKKLVIADLGCSSGPNSLFAVTELIKAVDKRCKEVVKIPPPEYQIYLNDLPGNDFNTVFRSLSLPSETTTSCFFAGVAGSFYGRLFPTNTLHFVHSSYSLQWLSQVPKGLEGNKGNIYMSKTSPQSVLEAYYQQFKHDFAIFLKCRAQEVVSGGRMVLTIIGRTNQDPPNGDCCSFWELLAMAFNEMVSEGVIREEEMDGFNIPNYTPSPAEVKAEVLKEGSFLIQHLQTSEVNWSSGYDIDINNNSNGRRKDAYNFGRIVRAAAEPLMVDHFGEEDDIIDDVFRRYELFIADRMSKHNTKFVNVTVSLVRK